jgi:hypothetical protein
MVHVYMMTYCRLALESRLTHLLGAHCIAMMVLHVTDLLWKREDQIMVQPIMWKREDQLWFNLLCHVSGRLHL